MIWYYGCGRGPNNLLTGNAAYRKYRKYFNLVSSRQADLLTRLKYGPWCRIMNEFCEGILPSQYRDLDLTSDVWSTVIRTVEKIFSEFCPCQRQKTMEIYKLTSAPRWHWYPGRATLKERSLFISNWPWCRFYNKHDSYKTQAVVHISHQLAIPKLSYPKLLKDIASNILRYDEVKAGHNRITR